MTDCRLEVYPGILKRWHWRFVCRGVIICTSSPYSNSTNAMAGARTAVRNFSRFDVTEIKKVPARA